MSVLYGVSVGPGDYELLTLKAVRILKETQIIAVPRTNNESTMALSIIKNVIDLTDKEVVCIDFPMTRDREICEKNYRKISREIGKLLDTGRDVAFITIGDASVFSTFSYISGICMEAGYEVRVIPGVPSFLDVAARLNKPLALGDESFIVMSGTSRHLDKLMETDANKVIMKSNRCVDKVKELLKEKEVAGIENCGLETEKVYRGVEGIEECGYFTTLISS